MTLGIIFVSIKTVSIFLKRQLVFLQNKYSLKISAQVSSLIYDKILTSSPSSYKRKCGQGEIINFLTMDVGKLKDHIGQLTYAYIFPFVFVYYFYLLYNYFGISVYFTLIVTVLIVIIEVILLVSLKRYTRKNSKKKDKRMKLIIEAFDSIKFIKMYGLEDIFTEKILNARKEEQFYGIRIYRTQIASNNIVMTTSILTGIVTIFFYEIFERDEIDISTILIGITIFDFIIPYISGLSGAISSFISALNSAKRIEVKY